MISDAQGSVEGRAPDQPGWSPRAAKDVLVESERLRTLSASTAQVTFRDLSRLRLNPNSNAIIQRMRSDPLTGAEITKVSLVNGDFYALLNQLGDRTAFEVEVPGVETETQSSDFWVKHEGGESRFANYDAPALEITRGDETISLGENEGAVVPVAGAAQRADVLARVELDAPFDGEQLYDPAVTLGWEPAAGRRGLLARGRRRRRLQRDAGLGMGGARHVADRRGAGARRPLLAGLLARPARAARACGASAGASGSSTTGRRPSSRCAQPQEDEIVTAAEVDGRRRERARRAADRERRLRPGRRQRRLPDRGDGDAGAEHHRRRRRRSGGQPHRADAAASSSARSAP